MDFAYNFSVEVYNKYETRLEKFASVNFLSAPHEDLRCLWNMHIFVKIQPIAPDKRVRPKASNLLVDLIEPLSLK